MSSYCKKMGKINWYVARISAVFILLYFVLLTKVWLIDQPVGYVAWKEALFAHYMQTSFILALVSILLHAWIGVWTIITDYVKCSFVQNILHCMALLMLVISLAWGISIVGL